MTRSAKIWVQTMGFPRRLLRKLRPQADNFVPFIGELDYQPQKLSIYCDSRAEAKRVNPCAKEPDTIQWIHRYFRPGDVFYDVGANIGVYSLIAAKHLHGQLTVFAFEPAWFNLAQLNRNIILNQLESSITPLGLALSDKVGLAWLNYSSLEVGSALHSLDEPVDDLGVAYTPVSRQRVASETIDDLVERFGFPVPNHIKVDVDGSQAKVLQGAAQTLNNPALRSLLIEFDLDRDQDQAAIDRLISQGFRVENVLSKLEAKRRRVGDYVMTYEKWRKYEKLRNYTFVRD